MEVIKRKRPLLITDTQTEPQMAPLQDFLRRHETHCLMIVPLLARGEVTGLIGIDLANSGRVFTEDEVALAETIAGQLAGAIANAQLYTAAQQEIAERRRTQNELARTRDEALEASRFKSQLLAKVSHELRTPLGVILGYTELLQGGTFGEVTHGQAEIAGEVIESTHYLTNMVNELLDQAKLEANTLQVENRPFKVADLLNVVETQMGVYAQGKDLDLSFIVSDNLPPLMFGDQNRLQQILMNLVGNAIKFTHLGAVTVHLYRSQPGYWCIKVSDTGIGIPAEAHDYIFEPFKQIDGSLVRQNSGTGLGLSIVRQLVELMGGYVTLVSELDHGSEFVVNLPLVSA
jgi:signal transduction histidine kinase